ncbi:IclR family transcriptional regulator [Bordetella bronchiseptica]|uniref:IclR family transcriptional regulator n=1 Tax=Bordetella bronchiseptica TaxID=518 RepID=UPI00028A61C2|nr:IclR family transcriptional regulator C-terminal domain-containing protein [Bordetella bronchiseptica]KCV29677.1 transcriptional regulator, IclR family, C-terminal domain protein [Bordetella bronchiseptica 00-P-2730]AWQ07868.1 IclR family transcriptional regulator [Bordetella bronchiseptica]KDC18481.1 transcriptional regulator, IclR family, C-terminal domain protein [Bordetella bronchiseptica E014]KDC59075.1 transcriptional regulator, IclR family, C-terminal domain protein [Bordetella bronch
MPAATAALLAERADHPLYVASVEKAMRVLEAFDAARDSLSLTDIVQLTGMGKSAAQRFTHTWEALGYLAKDPQSRRYRLGPKVVELSYYFLRSDHLVSLAAPHLVALREHCGLAVNMSVLSGDDMIYLLRLPSRQLTLVEMLPGRRMPAWSNSAGRMLLSQRDDASVRDLLERAAPQPYTPRTQTDPQALLAEIRQAREDGYAITQDQVLLNQMGVATLLRDERRQPLAAISVTAAADEYPRARLVAEIVPQMLKAAYAICGA